LHNATQQFTGNGSHNAHDVTSQASRHVVPWSRVTSLFVSSVFGVVDWSVGEVLWLLFIGEKKAWLTASESGNRCDGS